MKAKINYKMFLFFILSLILFLLVGFLFFSIGKIYFPAQSVAEVFDNRTSKYTVIIDAGHGGVDSGAGSFGIYEKDLTLSISKKISEFLSLYNIDVRMTRTEDKLLCEDNSKNKKRDDLLNRYKFAKSFENQIFLSIHINKFPESKYRGLQVFYSTNHPYSESLALLLQSNAKDAIQPENNRKIKEGTSSIYLLDRLNCPAVLIECGFISNPEECELLSADSYQKRLAFTIANSIIEFINI